MDEIGVKEGMTVADVGAGDGYFTFHLAERVGNDGKVFACDIDNRALQVIRNKCAEKGIQNISVILGKEDDPLIPQKSVDIILMVNVIHLLANASDYLKKLQQNLKANGSLVIVQWDAEKMDSESKGWDPDDRALHTLRANLRRIYDADFEVVQIEEFLPMQLIYVCQPSSHK
jgi:ubiquinone/menaquinone biosynthesis C-methylase UbiE